MQKLVIVSLLLCLVAYAFGCTPTGTVGSNQCGNGYCVATAEPNVGVCKCYEGWMDISVEQPCAKCAEGFISKTDPVTQQTSCVRDSSTSPCAGVDCLHGQCVLANTAGATGYKCECQVGWTTGDTNKCDTCAYGYEGVNCDQVTQPSDPCVDNPCARITNSHCVATSNTAGATGFTCKCNEGYYLSAPDTCTQISNNDPCANVNCGEGTCQAAATAPLGFVCVCPEGITHKIEIIRNDATGELTQVVRFCSICAAGFQLTFDEGSGAAKCTPIPTDPCSGYDCGIGGRCYINQDRLPACACFPQFQIDTLGTKKCTKCNTGYVDATQGTNTDPAFVRCSQCDTGFKPVGTLCIPSTDDCPNCNHGTCTIVKATVDTTGAATDATFKQCICDANWVHDPIKGPCSVCATNIGDPNNNCAPPTAGDGGLKECMERCQANDPNSICIVKFANALTTGTDPSFAGFECVCDRRFIRDERTKKCSICATGYFSENAFCDKERCPGGCGKGRCVEVKSATSILPTFKCECPAGWDGINCENSVALPETCPECGPNEVCTKVTIVYKEDFTIAVDNAALLNLRKVEYKCECKPGFVDWIGEDGSRKRCAVCEKGRTGPNCGIEVIPGTSLCDEAGCPPGTRCKVVRIAGELKTGCFCPDGSLWKTNNDCSHVVDPVDPTTDCHCPEHADCVKSSAGTKCVCRKGFRRVKDANGFRCVKEDNLDCPLDCGDKRVCVRQTAYDATISEKAECVCRLPNSHWDEVNQDCVCDEGFEGKFCEKKTFNPCANKKCKEGTICVARGDEADCICAGSSTGFNCDIDLCKEVVCEGGQVCFRGDCVCPLNQVLNQDNKCVDRPRDQKPTTSVDVKCTDDTNKDCFVPPTDREITTGEDTTDGKTFNSDRPPVDENDKKVDRVETEFRGGVNKPMKLCLRKFLGEKDANNVEQIKIAIKACIELLSLEIVDLGEGDVTSEGTVVKTLELGTVNADFDGEVTVDKTETTDGSGKKQIEVKLSTGDGIVVVKCVIASKTTPVADSLVTAQATKCAVFANIPSAFYEHSKTKLCFRARVIREANGEIFVNQDAGAAVVSVYAKDADGNVIDAPADLSFETSALIGSVKVAIDYTANVDPNDATVILVRGCFRTLAPDHVLIDPQMSADKPISVGAATPSTGAPQTPNDLGNTGSATTIMLSALALLFSLLALLF